MHFSYAKGSSSMNTDTETCCNLIIDYCDTVSNHCEKK